MIWIAYAGLCVVGIGCLILMVGLFEYPRIKQNLTEELTDSECGILSQEKCEEAKKIGMEYLLQRQDDNYRTLTIGSIGICSGMALFAADYTRPSWFRRISTEPAR
jgi:hypothetical protein